MCSHRVTTQSQLSFLHRLQCASPNATFTPRWRPRCLQDFRVASGFSNNPCKRPLPVPLDPAGATSSPMTFHLALSAQRPSGPRGKHPGCLSRAPGLSPSCAIDCCLLPCLPPQQLTIRHQLPTRLLRMLLPPSRPPRVHGSEIRR